MIWLLFIAISVGLSPANGPGAYASKAACVAAAQAIVAANPGATGAYICFQQGDAREQIAQEGAVAFGPQSPNAAAAEQRTVTREAMSAGQ